MSRRDADVRGCCVVAKSSRRERIPAGTVFIWGMSCVPELLTQTSQGVSEGLVRGCVVAILRKDTDILTFFQLDLEALDMH